jgi:hypothetical protein
MENSAVIRVSLGRDAFFKYWLEFLNPLYKLLDREILVLSLFLKEREDLARYISDDALVDTFLFSRESRLKVLRQVPGFKYNNLNNVLSSLRKKGIITPQGRLLVSLVPPLKAGSEAFSLTLLFEMKS